MQLSIFFFYRLQTVLIRLPFRVGGLNEDIDHLVASQPSVPLHLRPRLCRRWWAQMRFWYHLVASQPSVPRICSLAFAGVGGLKWTRTIDLTLIRRVL